MTISPKRNHNLDITEIVVASTGVIFNDNRKTKIIPSLTPRPPGKTRAMIPSVIARGNPNPILQGIFPGERLPVNK